MVQSDARLSRISDINDANEVVVAFASNPAFQAAIWQELTTPDNPYRRPVRPDDLKWTKYHDEMPADRALQLSALLGHRMLRNIFDLDISLVSPVTDKPIADAREHFYSTQNQVNAAIARPALERHLFAFLDDQQRPPVETVDALIAVLDTRIEQLQAQPLTSPKVARELTGKREAAVFILIQYHGLAPAVRAALGKAGLGEFPAHADALAGQLLDSYRQWVGIRPAYRSLLEGAGLSQTPGAHWQLLLGTSLARGNHIQSLAHNGGRLAELAGAAYLWHLTGPRDTADFRETLAGVFGADAQLEGFDLGAGWSVDTDPAAALASARTVAESLVTSFGTGAIADFLRGFEHAAQLRTLWDQDLALQIGWADQIELYKDYAEKIQRYLDDNSIVVDLDTFVEGEEVTSTTHVHNEHRLVSIEKGQMHFWNNVTHKIELNTGDRILIPISRLHGSTVLSGVCTYHQPIISDDLLQQVI